jgi:hypothetical protein
MGSWRRMGMGVSMEGEMSYVEEYAVEMEVDGEKV